MHESILHEDFIKDLFSDHSGDLCTNFEEVKVRVKRSGFQLKSEIWTLMSGF